MLSNPSPIAPAGPAVTPNSHSQKPTLLIVDDEEGPRDSIRIIFKDEYRILAAEDGSEAVALARENPIDAALLDIRMKGMSGIEVLNALKAIDPATEVVMLTAYQTVETARQALRLGACDYLNKPFDIATIRDAVRNAMEHRAISLQMRENNRNLQALQEEIQNQKLREEMARTRGEIYASIIHDINGPLTVISGFIEAINERIAGSTQLEGEKLELVKDRLTRLTRQVTNCIQISNRYLSFLRAGTGQVVRVSVNQILNDLGELLKTHSSRQENTLTIQPLPADISTQINGTDLIQVLLNLVINAFQSAEHRLQVEIRAALLEAPLDLARFVDGPHDVFVNRRGFANSAPILSFAVADNGPGIRPEVIGKVFDPYFTTKAPGQGTGLGLAIVKRLVEQARGALHLHSEPGQGTVFTIYLPHQAPQG